MLHLENMFLSSFLPGPVGDQAFMTQTEAGILTTYVVTYILFIIFWEHCDLYNLCF